MIKKECRYIDRPKFTFPCNQCKAKECNDYERPATCNDCRLSWHDCERRGKNQRRLNICDKFKLS